MHGGRALSGREVVVKLTPDEINFTINMCPPSFVWPDPYNQDHMNILPVGEQEKAGGPVTRLKIVAARQHMQRHPQQRTYPVSFTVPELWLMDAFINHSDYRSISLDPQGRYPVLRFAEKIWDALILVHAELVPVEYLPDSRPDTVAYSAAPLDAAEVERQRDFLRSIDSLGGE